jgi:hypothetical protein
MVFLLPAALPQNLRAARRGGYIIYRLGLVNSTLKCSTQLFADAEVARLARISICNM